MAGNKGVGEDQTANSQAAPDIEASALPTPQDRSRGASPQDAPDPRSEKAKASPRPLRTPAILAAFLVSAIFGLSAWYLVQPQPLLVQGEADATRVDIAARVDGRVGNRPVERGDKVAAGAVLYEITNPQLLTSLRQAEAAKELPPMAALVVRR